MAEILTDQEALLAAIRADPDDDVARVIYADWLQEHDRQDRCPERCDGPKDTKQTLFGQPMFQVCWPCKGTGYVSNNFAARAEFIRLGCKIASHNPQSAVALYHKQQRERGLECETPGCSWCADLDREHELLKQHHFEWFGGSYLFINTVEPTTEDQDRITQGHGTPYLVTRRGFAEVFIGSWSDWQLFWSLIKNPKLTWNPNVLLREARLTTWPDGKWLHPRMGITGVMLGDMPRLRQHLTFEFANEIKWTLPRKTG